MIPGIGDVNVSAVELNPARYYAMIKLVESIDRDKVDSIGVLQAKIEAGVTVIEVGIKDLARASDDMMREVKRTTRRRSSRDSLEDDRGFDRFEHTLSGLNFINVVFESVRALRDAYHSLYTAADGIKAVADSNLIMSKEQFTPEDLGDPSRLQHMMLEIQLNRPALQRVIEGITRIDMLEGEAIRVGEVIVQALERYYQTLSHRHSVDGIEIHEDPITTDLAISIFENIDAHGEIEDGKNPDEISAYSLSKAKIITEAVKGGMVGEFIRNHLAFIDFIEAQLRGIYETSAKLKQMFHTEIECVYTIMERPLWKRIDKLRDFNDEMAFVIGSLRDLDPQSVMFRDRNVLLSADERFNLRFRNESLATVAKMLKASHSSPQDIVNYVLQRKKELHDYFKGENSFYVCRIGHGNPFGGEAPGELQVIPGIKPVSHLDEVLGSGFDEIREFFGQTDAAEKWHDLFLATSPSRTTDKSNVLLIGPQGCGKTEVFRAVAADKESLSISAQGSDFNTCWKGEAEKNPKRLFEAAVKLQKESKKHVHILIDEVDEVLNNDKDYGAYNLTTEFQILMDGVVSYPRISIWGATNNPRRIPMPMIRRFSKVLIVGELDDEDRAKLLKRWAHYMPVGTIPQTRWLEWGKKLEGATGDVVRKCVDEVWRTRMNQFVQERPGDAERLIDWLNNEARFDIKDFDADKRNLFNVKLGQHMHLEVDDIDRAIDMALENRAIHEQVETAKLTYDNARLFLTDIRDSRR